MAIMNCTQFSRETGWPLASVRRWCNMGIIRHVRLGRAMLFDYEEAQAAIRKLQETPPITYYTTGTAGRKCRSQTMCAGYSLPPPDGHGGERLRALLKGKKERPTGGNRTDFMMAFNAGALFRLRLFYCKKDGLAI